MPPLSLVALFALLALALTPPPPTIAAALPPPTAPCKTSFYPKLCRALLSSARLPPDPYSYGRYSVKQALKQARRTSEMLDRYLSHSASRATSRGALEDCRQLSALNAAYLEQVDAELGKVVCGQQASASHVGALMSALVTNQQTCFDGLEAEVARSSKLRVFAPVGPEINGPLANATQMYGVSLELVTAALAQSRRRAPTPLPKDRRGGRNLQEDLQDRIPMNGSVIVAKDGTGDFTTVADAVEFAPNNTSIEEDGYFFIIIRQGVYEENVVVARNKKNLVLLGDGINRTVITGNRSVVDGWTTFNSATFAVHGERFIAVGITFENTAGPEKHQAVAVRNSADLSTFYRCSFLGYQDTLYAHSLRQFYRDCDVYGTVDFIFGNAAAVLQNCNIYPRRPLPGQRNAVTAQGRTHPDQNTGISIHNCTIMAAPDLQLDPSSASTYLGRPWKEYSRTVYMQSYIDGVVEPTGWLEWNGTFALTTLYYGEFENYGPGSNTSERVQWPGHSLMDATQAFNFTVYNFTAGDDWLPYTSIPYYGGLL